MKDRGVLAGEVAVVVGAGGALGRAAACVLAEAGASVVLAGRGHDGLEATAGQVRSRGGRALVAPTDVTSPEGVAGLVDLVLDEHGAIDVLVNFAGRLDPMGVPLWDADPEEWLRTMATNVTGVFLACRAVIPQMLRQGHGHIVNPASASARVPIAKLGNLLRQQGGPRPAHRGARARARGQRRQRHRRVDGGDEVAHDHRGARAGGQAAPAHGQGPAGCPGDAAGRGPGRSREGQRVHRVARGPLGPGRDRAARHGRCCLVNGVLAGDVALVTGAGGAFGRAAVKVLAEAGATVVLAGRRREPLERAAAQVRRARVMVVPTDITDPGQVERLVDTTLDEHGAIDILVNLAGRLDPVGVPLWGQPIQPSGGAPWPATSPGSS